MADRYWVGGTGQWDGTAGTKWSTTAGGAGGASVPTSADNVFFTSATSYTVTISGARACLGFTVSAGNVTFAGTATPSLTVSAGMSMVAATVWGMTGTVTFNATTAQTISINGVNMASPVVFNGVGGTWTLGSAARFRQFTLTNGTFSTSASNYALTVYTFTISATGTKTLSFNGSTVTVVGTGFTSATVFDNLATSGFTFNAGTSNFVCGAEVTGATYFVSTTTQNITFYNFTLTTLFLRGLTFTVGGTNQNSAVFTFNNLTVTGNFSTANRVVTIPANGSYKANMKINGTLTLSGGISAFQRVILTVPLSDTSLQSTASSTAQITAVATSLTDVDFYGIHNDDFNQGVTPAAWTGTRLGDASNNTNITFPAAKTVYYVAATAGNWSSANWSTTSGGATASTNYPLPQDTAIINNSSGTGTLTLNYGQVYYGTINCSTRSTALTISLSSNRLLSVNNITLSSSITMSGANSLVFMGTRACTITASGATISCPFTIDRPINGNSITLGSAVTTTSNITMRTGDINLSSFTLTCGSTFSIDPQNTTFETSIIAGTGNITLSGTGTVFTAAAAATTEHLITGVPIFNVTNNTATATTVTADNLTATNSMIFNFTAGTYALTLTGNFNSVNFTGFAGTLNNSLRSFYGSFTASTGMTLTAGTNAQTFAATAGTNTITSNGKTFDFPVTFNGVGGTWQLSGALTVGSTRTVTLTNGTLNLNNQTLTTGSVLAAGGTTIAFGTGNITIIGTGTVWQDYNVISTGSQVVNVNNNTATATTVSPGAASEANALNFNFTSGTYALTLSGGYFMRSVNFTGFAGTLDNQARSFFGSFTASTGMTLTGGGNKQNFYGSGTNTITSNGKTFDFPIEFANGTHQLSGALTVGSTRTVTLFNGTLNLNNQTLTTGLFSSSNSFGRTLAFGTGNITLTGSGTVWDTSTATGLTTTGTAVVNVNNNTATATTVSPGSLAISNSISFNFTSGTYALTLSAGNVNSLNFTGFAGTLDNQARTIFGALTISTGMTLTAGTNAQTFAATAGTNTITSNGKTFDFPVTFNGAGGTWQLSDALTLGSTRTLTHTNGTLNLNGQTLNCGASYTTAAGTKNITFNGGNLQCTNSGATAFNNAAPTGFTTTAGTGTGKISMTSASAKTFVGGGSTYNCNLSNEGLGTLTITGNNTFLSINNTANGSTITLPHGGTTTVSGLSINGINGTLNTLNSSSAGIQATLSDASGTTEIDFIFVRDVAFTGGSTFNFGTNAFNVDNCSGINAPYAQNFAVF